MWFADIYCDPAWVSERRGILGPKRFVLRGPKSVSLGIEIEFHFFGDADRVRHIRALMHTDDQRTAETCLSDHPKPANEYHLKTGQREQRLGH
jgi:hypothetical protein